MLSVRRKLNLLAPRRRRQAGLAVLLPATALLASLLTAAPASADVTYIQMIPSAYGGSCLDLWGGNQQPYNPVVAYPCNSSDFAQQWAFDATTSTIHFVAPGGVVTNNCLDVYADHTTSGTPVDLYPCNGTAAQVWSYGGINNELWGGAAGLCLDIPYFDVTPPGGPPTQLWVHDCNDGLNQQWYLNGYP
jgi:hypothetical protein